MKPSALLPSLQSKFGINVGGNNLSDIIQTLIPYVFIIAGLILFFMIIAGGFTMLTAVSDPNKAEKGKSQLTSGIIGFIIVVASYWIIQVFEVLLGITIFG